jgi:hypothetical protein
VQSSARSVWWPGLFSVQRDATRLRQLVKTDSPFFTTKERVAREPLSPLQRLLHVPHRLDEDVIVAEHTYTAAGQPIGTIAKRLNIVTGRATILSLGVPGPVRSWLFDPADEPRLVTTFKEGRITVHWRGPSQADWRLLAEHPQYEAPFTPLYVDAKGSLYVTMPHPRTGHRVLSTLDFEAGRPSPEYRVSAPGFDFNGQLFAAVGGEAAPGVGQEVDAETTVWFDARLRALQEKADSLLPGRVNRITCRRCTQPDTTALIWSWSDQPPGQFWIGLHPHHGVRRTGDSGLDHHAAGPPQPGPAVLLVHGAPGCGAGIGSGNLMGSSWTRAGTS